MCPAGVRENHSKGELDMPMKRYKAEQIVTLLRQIEVGVLRSPHLRVFAGEKRFRWMLDRNARRYRRSAHDVVDCRPALRPLQCHAANETAISVAFAESNFDFLPVRQE
jgi:hypothetical protein